MSGIAAIRTSPRNDGYGLGAHSNERAVAKVYPRPSSTRRGDDKAKDYGRDRMTTTGHAALATQCSLVEPMSIPTNSP